MEEMWKGCLLQPEDERDYVYEELLWAWEIMSKEEWEKWFDIEKELWITLNPNNQFQSYSCVWQSFSKYWAVLNFIETWHWVDESAKAMYSQITQWYWQWAYLRDAAELATKWWFLLESVLKSYKEDWTTDETFMIDKSWFNEEMTELAKTLQSKEYRLVKWNWIDIFARAIKDWHWMVAWVVWINNWTWTSLKPQPPNETDPQWQMWWHAIYFGRFRMNNGKKEIWILNSWGNVWERWWQWLWEEWFTNDWRWVFNPWVLIDKPNNENMNIKKEINKPNIYLINETTKTKTMIVDMETLNSLWGNFVEVESLSSYADNWTLVFVDRIIN